MTTAENHPADTVRFSQDDAAAIVGVSAGQLDVWRALAPAPDGRAATGLTLADLVGFAVTRDLAERQGAGLEGFAAGLARLFQVLDQAPDVTRLDGLVALVGPQTAELLPRRARRLNNPAGYLVAPLAPVLADLRNQVFS